MNKQCSKHEIFSIILGTFILVITMNYLLSITSFAQTISNSNSPKMTNINSHGVNLSISETGSASIYGYIYAQPSVTSTSIRITLQRNILGIWFDVTSWNSSSEATYLTISKTYQVSHGKYRVVMNCSADSETQSSTSGECTY